MPLGLMSFQTVGLLADGIILPSSGFGICFAFNNACLACLFSAFGLSSIFTTDHFTIAGCLIWLVADTDVSRFIARLVAGSFQFNRFR